MTEIGLGHYLTLGAIIFSIGIIGIFLNRKNIIVILILLTLKLLSRFFDLEKYPLHLERKLLHLKINNVLNQFQSSTLTPWLDLTSINSTAFDGLLEI